MVVAMPCQPAVPLYVVVRGTDPVLQVLGTVGEPINPEAWKWYHQVVGEGRCPIVDTWWQTETGGHMITPLPGAWPGRPGSATLPFFGVAPVILHPESGQELEGVAEGVLCFKQVLRPQLCARFEAYQSVAAIPSQLHSKLGWDSGSLFRFPFRIWESGCQLLKFP